MLRYTGHPFYDVGVATVTAFAGKSAPEGVEEEHLAQIAEFMEREYQKEPLKSFLGVAFTTNAWFNQPAFDNQPEKRKDYAARLLKHYSERADRGEPDERCVFTGEPVSRASFSENLPPGRAFRQHVPLVTGEKVINFHPWGNAGLPISGKAAVCIQAFPLGCAKCGGRLLAVHSDIPDLLLEFATEFLEMNRRALILSSQAGSSKMSEAPMSAKTLLVDVLCKAEERRREEREGGAAASITAYHVTNSGQSNPLDRRNPPLQIYHLPMEITGFLRATRSQAYRHQWRSIVDRAWQIEAVRRRQKGKDEGLTDDSPNNEGGDGKRSSRNFLYEDLFRLPDNASEFVRRYLLRFPVPRARADDPRQSYSLRTESDLVSWGIAELFLRGVMCMTEGRVVEIRELGDRLADYVNSENDRRFFTAFYRERNYEYFRNTLIRANLNRVKAGGQPLIGLDSYIEVFEEGEDQARSDWKLARDLVLIRMIERLHQLGWIGTNIDALPEGSEEE